MEEQIELIPKKTNGQLFKEKSGFSKSVKRAMQKNGLEGKGEELPAYRKIRNEKKKKIKQTKIHSSTMKKLTGGDKKDVTKKKK